MTRAEFGILACTLRTFYPNQGFLPNEQAAELWFDALKDLSYPAASYAVKKWALNNKWVPTVAEIRQAATIYDQDQKLPQEIRVFLGYAADPGLVDKRGGAT